MSTTAAEVVSLAFTRNVSELHFKTSDITLAQYKYVDGYIEGYSETSTFFTTYCKPVIAYGCAVDCWERIASEVTDRGIVDMVTQGATRIDPNNKAALKSEYSKTLSKLIEIMVIEAESESGITVLDADIDYEEVGFTGTENIGEI